MKQTDKHIFFCGGIYSQWYSFSMAIVRDTLRK
jgi:hypothetical protein